LNYQFTPPYFDLSSLVEYNIEQQGCDNCNANQQDPAIFARGAPFAGGVLSPFLNKYWDVHLVDEYQQIGCEWRWRLEVDQVLYRSS
jgi:hypothetical protein